MSQTSLIPEICDNGIDDDQDGEIDLNDEDCFCPTIEIPSLIPNPSFEDLDCCPATHSSLPCATGWIQASAATTDYFHTCGWIGTNSDFIPQPIPDGEGVIGFYDGSFDIGIVNPNWKEYIGICLNDTLFAQTTYVFEFNIGFLDSRLSPPIDLTIFGTRDCSSLPFGNGDASFGCPSNAPGWTNLGSIETEGNNEWKRYKITVKPISDITTIVIGPGCNPRSLSRSPYYFLDNLILAKPEEFDMDIFAIGHPCDDNFALEIQFQDNIRYQWYRDGIAIAGATTSLLDNLKGEGQYQVKMENQNDCLLSRPYKHQLPFQSTRIREFICSGATYIFNDQEIMTAGVYWDTLKAINNCDSIIRLDLNFRDNIDENVTAKIFSGETYEISNTSYKIPGEYVQIIPSNSGCDSTIYLNLDYYSVYFPNVFSPNDDGVNDLFLINGGQELESVLTLDIYDRWGNIIYQGVSLNSDEGWNGLNNGIRAPTAVYVFSASILMDDLKSRNIKGSFTLVR